MSSHERVYTPAYIYRRVERQGHRCVYCLLPYGTVVRRHGKEVTQKPRGDHFVPWAWNEVTDETNLVAACQICNGIKSSNLFETVDECRRFVMGERWRREYRVLFIPTHPLTESPWAWASEYARWMIG